MHELLETAIEAHGGWARWQQISALKAQVAIGGGLWSLKGWPDVFSKAKVFVDPHRQRVEYSPFIEAGRHSVYEPQRTAIVTDVGEVIEQRRHPRRSFAGHGLTTPWDAQQLIYFTGYAMWTYLCAPFLFAQPGFECREIEPWHEQDERWRRLSVIFPAGIHSHCREQTFYFDASGLLRRHDYSVDIMGGTASGHYADDHRTFAGLVFPTKRRVYALDADGRPIRARVAVAIDVHDIEVCA